MSPPLPNTWVSASLGQLGTWLGGGTPSKANPAYWQRGTIHWVSPKDMKRFFIDSAQDQITKKAVKESATNLVPTSSVLMVTRSGILAHSFPVAINTVDVAINQDLKAWTSLGIVEPTYAAYFLKARARNILQECSKDGTTVSSIDFDRLSAYPVAVAPAHEQRRIVSKIDKLFSRIDEGEQALKRVEKLVERYRQSVLRAAVTGELTRDWRAARKRAGEPVESGAALLARILKARRAGWETAEFKKMKAKGKPPTDDRWKQKYKEPASPDTTELPELPEGWVWAGIEEFLNPLDVGMKTGPFGTLLSKSEHVATGIPVVGIENIGSRGEFVAGAKIHITAAKAEELAMYDVVQGDVVISRSGTVGELCVIPSGLGRARFSTNIMRLRLAADFNAKFFCYLFRGSPSVLGQVRTLCKGSTRDFLNQHILHSLVFPIPPMCEQAAIVNEVEKRMSDADGFISQVRTSATAVKALRQSILKAAFSGQLVPQDPHDEPASKLLERTAAERITAPVAKRGRKARATKP